MLNAIPQCFMLAAHACCKSFMRVWFKSAATTLANITPTPISTDSSVSVNPSLCLRPVRMSANLDLTTHSRPCRSPYHGLQSPYREQTPRESLRTNNSPLRHRDDRLAVVDRR